MKEFYLVKGPDVLIFFLKSDARRAYYKAMEFVTDFDDFLTFEEFEELATFKTIDAKFNKLIEFGVIRLERFQ